MPEIAMFPSKNTPYINCVQLVHRDKPSLTNLSHDRLRSWCAILCPHVPVADAVNTLLRGDSIACPGIYVENVFHALRVTTRDVPGVAHEPRLELVETRCASHESAPIAFQTEAIAYAHAQWPNELLKEREWSGYLELYHVRRNASVPECVGAFVLRSHIEFTEYAALLDHAVFSVIPDGTSLHIRELAAATQGHPTKQWLCGILCNTCRGMHFGDCSTLPHALQSAWIRSVALNL